MFETHDKLNRVTVPVLVESSKIHEEAIKIQWRVSKVQAGESQETMAGQGV